MIVTKDKIDKLPYLFHFHLHEHEVLSILLLNKMSKTMDFKLIFQKASIQLVNSEPFAVIGFRRSQKYIFLEFFNESKIENKRIIKTTKSKINLIINRVNIVTSDEIDTELLNWINDSYKMLK